MKKLLNGDPVYMIGIAILLFGISFINSVQVDATSFSDLSWWGKIPVCGFMIILGILFTKYLLIPFGKWFIGLVK
jgi:hypothetical protein